MTKIALCVAVLSVSSYLVIPLPFTPIGAYSKDEVRDIAKKIGLAVADKPDSQEICFIPDHDYGTFLEEQGEMPGAGIL